MKERYSNNKKVFLFLIISIWAVFSFDRLYSGRRGPIHINSEYIIQKDSTIRKILDETKSEYIDLSDLGKLRIVERDGSIKKNVVLKEIHSSWIIYEKDGSLHDFMISAIDRIEIGDYKTKAIYFDKRGMAKIWWIH